MYAYLPFTTPGRVRPACARRLGDAEVHQLDHAVVGDEHVLRRHVAVHEVELAAHADRRRCARSAARRRRRRRCAPRSSNGTGRALALADQPPDVDAVDVLHGDEVVVLDLAEVVDVHDVRVGELRRQPRLVEEHGAELFGLGQVRQDALDAPRAARSPRRRPGAPGTPRPSRRARAAAAGGSCRRERRRPSRKSSMQHVSGGVTRAACIRRVIGAADWHVVRRVSALDRAVARIPNSRGTNRCTAAPRISARRDDASRRWLRCDVEDEPTRPSCRVPRLSTRSNEYVAAIARARAAASIRRVASRCSARRAEDGRRFRWSSSGWRGW